MREAIQAVVLPAAVIILIIVWLVPGLYDRHIQRKNKREVDR